MKILVGGYYDTRSFKGDHFEGKNPFGEDIDTYTVKEALEFGAGLEYIEEWYEDVYGIEDGWGQLTEIEKAELIEKYTMNDELLGFNSFETEDEAKKYKEIVLEEVRGYEDDIKAGKIVIDKEGNYIYNEHYVEAKNKTKELLKAKGLSIKSLGEYAGWDYSLAHRIVNREDVASTTLETLIKIADFLKVEVTDLYEHDKS